MSRLTIVQYTGDYREAYLRLAGGGRETYQAQRYSVNLVGQLAQRLENLSVICAVSDQRYEEVLENGVQAIGCGLKVGFDPAEILPDLVRTRPDRVSLTTPMIPILKWLNAKRIRTITPLADSFQRGSIRDAIRHRILAYYLNGPTVEWVGNHGINACLSLIKIGVRADKIVPWDWPPSHRPSEYQPRLLRRQLPLELLYVGSVTVAKGVGDLIQAVALLSREQFPINLSIVGRAPDESLANLAKACGIENIVRFVGLVANEDIPQRMRSADIVVIPSRHEYPEGLPLTIYEALSARTPIVASDHPMFRGALANDQSAIIFAAGRPDSLASSIRRLLTDAELYKKLSINSEGAWQKLQLPFTMGDFLQSWLADCPSQTEWLRSHRLTSGRYETAIRERAGR